MNIAFFISEDYSFIYPIIERTIVNLENEHNVKGIIVFPDTLVGLKGINIPLKYLELFGFIPTIKLAVRTIADRYHIYLKYLTGRTSYSSFEQMAHHKNIQYLKYNSPNNNYVINWIKDNQIDIIFVFVGYILKNDIINAPRCCIINKHSAALPANRGVLPVFWAMLKDDPVGFTLHKVTDKLDSGEIVFQKIYIKQPLSLYEWYQIIHADIPDAITEVIAAIDKKRTQIIDTNAIIPSYNSLPIKEDVKTFYKKGLKII
jgi:folate-dependent phosphoribosylglycinamide formyltransferase PurN